jgi:hypothetical protein
MSIITEEMVFSAVALASPTIEKVLQTEGLTWGPKWVSISIVAPGIHTKTTAVGEKPGSWDPKWGESRNFSNIALKKMQAADREQENTSVIVNEYPWALQDNEYLYPGGVTKEGISVGVSGACGRVDEMIASIIVDAIICLAQMETDKRKEKKQMQI